MKPLKQILEDFWANASDSEKQKLLACREKYARGLELVSEALDERWHPSLMFHDTETVLQLILSDDDAEEWDVDSLCCVRVKRNDAGRAVTFRLCFHSGDEVDSDDCEDDSCAAMAAQPRLKLVYSRPDERA